MFDEVAIEIHETSVARGFWDAVEVANQEQKDIFIYKQLMTIVSDAAQVMEAIQNDKGEEAITDEIANILIRTFDLYVGLVKHEYTTVSLDHAFDKKTEVNRSRTQKHGVK